MTRLPGQRLWSLRNAIPIDDVIRRLDVPAKEVEGYFRFLCPGCGEFHTATRAATNLAHCFRCHQNYNPIDLVMTVRKTSFLEAVRYLTRYFGQHLSD